MPRPPLVGMVPAIQPQSVLLRGGCNFICVGVCVVLLCNDVSCASIVNSVVYVLLAVYCVYVLFAVLCLCVV